MNIESLQSYALPLVIVGYFVWRFFKFRRIKKEMPQMIGAGGIVVDVRTRREYQMGSCPGSVNIPLDELDRRSGELDRSRQIILCCASGTRSGMALGILKKNGFENVVNAGPWTNTLA